MYRGFVVQYFSSRLQSRQFNICTSLQILSSISIAFLFTLHVYNSMLPLATGLIPSYLYGTSTSFHLTNLINLKCHTSQHVFFYLIAFIQLRVFGSFYFFSVNPYLYPYLELRIKLLSSQDR